MKKDLIQKVLESESAVKAEGKGVFVVSDEVELTVIVDVSGQEALAVPKVKRVTIAAETLLLETHKGERIYVDAAAGFRALKFSPQDANRSRGTGFAANR
ncbi:MAG: hypothetical protein U0745_11940 [Polyangia bacterium]|jgi:hypothetical protein